MAKAKNEVIQPALELETFGKIRRADINEQMRESYLSYSMSVIVSRALPDARDGLKPVQRRILFVMYDTGCVPGAPYRKSARIVGDVLGKYHPHGDASVYEAMARMAQDFSMRYMLVDGQGNFGSVDGDPPAAMRYTEARLSKPAMDVLNDLDKNTVLFTDNYDGTQKEPSVLPAAFPNLLVNGATGIAVGMATNIPPHNLGEVCDGLTFMIDAIVPLMKKTQPGESLPEAEVDVDDLMRFVKGPDFPTGAIAFRFNEAVEGGDAIKACYATGRGKVIVQAKAHIEEGTRGKTHIIVTELPYGVNKASLIERIADLARDEKITGITDIRDESDRRGMRIVIDCGKDVDNREVLTSLYKHTAMRTTFGVIMLALVADEAGRLEPRVLSLRKILHVFLEHRRTVVYRRSQFDLEKALERAHILEGLVRALDIIDKIIKLIRASKDTEVARKGLQTEFKFSERQANAILEMPLRRLAALERQKLEDELAEKRKLIKFLQDLIDHPIKIMSVIREELVALKDKYGDSRKTVIVGGEDKRKGAAQETARAVELKKTALTVHDLIPDEEAYVFVGANGKIGRTLEAPKVNSNAEIVPAAIVKATTKDLVYVVGSSGKAVVLQVGNIPREEVANGGGALLSGISGFPADDDIAGAFIVPKAEGDAKAEAGPFVITCTSGGMVKRSEAALLPRAPGNMFVMCGVSEGDYVVAARLVQGAEDLMLFTQQGMAIRFKQDEVRPMGLPAGGVVGMKLDEGDIIMSMAFADENAGELEVVLGTTDGRAKRIAFDDYPVQGRAGKGVITAKLVRDATVADAVIATPENTIVYVTLKGNAKSLKAKNLTRRGRPAGGDEAIALSGSDRLARMVVV